ncbi:uncharacterized protein LOC141719275 [Apium graveolens]|uniref:uncharacterized protein LOC141719275 n=1 Tax=Apium graveolens TaxID=4045 RepID=UPI003D7A0938
MNLLQDWREAQKNGRKASTKIASGVRIWNSPPEGWVKINVDTAIFQDGSIGIGSIIRDSSGQFLSARCRKMVGAWQVREAEAISLKEAMSWVKEMNINHCVFETDSKSLAAACNGKPGEAYFGTIVLDCIHIMKHIDHVLVDFAYRSANTVAHELAKSTYSMSDVGEWHVTPPDFISHVLQLDSI